MLGGEGRVHLRGRAAQPRRTPPSHRRTARCDRGVRQAARWQTRCMRAWRRRSMASPLSQPPVCPCGSSVATSRHVSVSATQRSSRDVPGQCQRHCSAQGRTDASETRAQCTATASSAGGGSGWRSSPGCQGPCTSERPVSRAAGRQHGSCVRGPPAGGRRQARAPALLVRRVGITFASA